MTVSPSTNEFSNDFAKQILLSDVFDIKKNIFDLPESVHTAMCGLESYLYKYDNNVSDLRSLVGKLTDSLNDSGDDSNKNVEHIVRKINAIILNNTALNLEKCSDKVVDKKNEMKASDKSIKEVKEEEISNKEDMLVVNKKTNPSEKKNEKEALVKTRIRRRRPSSGLLV